MMIIENAEYNKACLNLIICTFLLLGMNIDHITFMTSSYQVCANSRQSFFDDYKNYEHTRDKIEELEKDGRPIYIESYFNYESVQEKIVSEIKNAMADNDSITVHIDYSSMPRSWYCKLPILLQGIIREVDNVYFWYCEGEYPSSYEEYSSAGICFFIFFREAFFANWKQ